MYLLQQLFGKTRSALKKHIVQLSVSFFMGGVFFMGVFIAGVFYWASTREESVKQDIKKSKVMKTIQQENKSQEGVSAIEEKESKNSVGNITEMNCLPKESTIQQWRKDFKINKEDTELSLAQITNIIENWFETYLAQELLAQIQEEYEQSPVTYTRINNEGREVKQRPFYLEKYLSRGSVTWEPENNLSVVSSNFAGKYFVFSFPTPSNNKVLLFIDMQNKRITTHQTIPGSFIPLFFDDSDIFFNTNKIIKKLSEEDKSRSNNKCLMQRLVVGGQLENVFNKKEIDFSYNDGTVYEQVGCIPNKVELDKLRKRYYTPLQKDLSIKRSEVIKIVAESMGTSSYAYRRMYGTVNPDNFQSSREEILTPNFAGKYLVLGFGCGTACMANYLVDVKTKKLYSGGPPGWFQDDVSSFVEGGHIGYGPLALYHEDIVDAVFWPNFASTCYMGYWNGSEMVESYQIQKELEKKRPPYVPIKSYLESSGQVYKQEEY